jgi:hypothetical protein
MGRQTVELRSWAFITISFLLGMMVSEFIDRQWRKTTPDVTMSLVTSHIVQIDTQP